MSITHILLNIGELAKISEGQRGSVYAVWQTSLLNPDFAAIARGCSFHAIPVTVIDDVRSAAAEAIAVPGLEMVETLTYPRSL